MNKYFYLHIVLFASLFLPITAHAEMITLTSGKMLEAEIISSNVKEVTVKFYDIQLTIPADEIASIQKSKANSSAAPNHSKSSLEISSTDVRQQLLIIDDELNIYMDSLLALLSTAYEAKDEAGSINLHLEGIRIIEQAISRVKQIQAQHSKDINLKKVALDYYITLIKYQNTLLQRIASNNSKEAQQAAYEAVKEMETKEKQLSMLLDRPSNPAMQTDELQKEKIEKTPEPTLPEQDNNFDSPDDEYQFLLNQTKELIRINTALRKETEELIRRNQLLHSEMKNFLEKSVAEMNDNQRARFLRYLNTL